MEHRLLRFSTELPFTPAYQQVIYIEDEYHKEVNDFIQKNYDVISERLHCINFSFCYIPRLVQEFSSEEYVSYFTPYQPKATGRAVDSTFMRPYLMEGEEMPHAAFIVYNNSETKKGTTVFSSFSIGCLVLPTLLDSLTSLLEEHEDDFRDHRYYCCTPDITSYKGNDPDYADKRFSDDIYDLLADVREKILRLRQKGVNELVLRSLLEPKTQLSRIRIDYRGRIFLPDYGNKEIIMTPLVKAVYFLFLHHPEGILFKWLPDYRQELLRIYNRLTGRSSDEGIRQSIDDVTNPCKNSINEKCARIREAFLREFDDNMARHYYITGNRGEAKGIALSEELIDDKFFPPQYPEEIRVDCW